MKIFIDARYLRDTFSGIATYSELLLQTLGRLDHKNQYVVLTHSSYRGDLELPENFTIIEDDARPVSWRTLLSLKKVVRKHDPDIFHALMPLWPIGIRYDCATMATVFDLQPLLDPYFTSGRPPIKRRMYDLFYHLTYRRCLTLADYLVTISYATKKDIARTVPQAVDHVLVIHPGYEPEETEPPTQDQIQRVREKYDLPKRYLLYLGSTRPNKNLPRMLDAFEELLKRHPEEKDLKWVMVLKADRFFDPFFATVRKKGLLRQVQIYDQVTEVEKRVFYQQAQLLYFATKYEGFGLPILEAQGHGLPILASNHSALPEVAGKGALLVNPDDVDAMATGLESVLYDAALRDELIQAGRHNLNRFSWDQAAREILNMYEHLLK